MNATVRIALQKLRNRGCLAERLDKFDLGIWQGHKHGDNAVLGQGYRGGDLGAECHAVDFCGLLGVLDGDRHMIETAQHWTLLRFET